MSLLLTNEQQGKLFAVGCLVLALFFGYVLICPVQGGVLNEYCSTYWSGGTINFQSFLMYNITGWESVESIELTGVSGSVWTTGDLSGTASVKLMGYHDGSYYGQLGIGTMSWDIDNENLEGEWGCDGIVWNLSGFEEYTPLYIYFDANGEGTGWNDIQTYTGARVDDGEGLYYYSAGLFTDPFIQFATYRVIGGADPPVCSNNGSFPILEIGPYDLALIDTSTNNPYEWCWTLYDPTGIKTTQWTETFTDTLVNEGWYTINHTATNSAGTCFQQDNSFAYISMGLVADFTVNGGYMPVFNQSPFHVDFVDTSWGNVTGWNWTLTYPDGVTTDQWDTDHVSFTFENEAPKGAYDMSLEVNDGLSWDAENKSAIVIILPAWQPLPNETPNLNLPWGLNFTFEANVTCAAMPSEWGMAAMRERVLNVTSLAGPLMDLSDGVLLGVNVMIVGLLTLVVTPLTFINNAFVSVMGSTVGFLQYYSVWLSPMIAVMIIMFNAIPYKVALLIQLTISLDILIQSYDAIFKAV